VSYNEKGVVIRSNTNMSIPKNSKVTRIICEEIFRAMASAKAKPLNRNIPSTSKKLKVLVIIENL
jgi:hypothetical protein